MKQRLLTLIVVTLLMSACGSGTTATHTPEALHLAQATGTPKPEPTTTRQLDTPTTSPETVTPVPASATPVPSTPTLVPPTATPPSTVAPTSEPTVTPLAFAPLQGDLGELRITILYDNVAYDDRLKAEWGFAALIEYGDQTLLFDTGGDAPTLLGNMGLLGIDPTAIETVMLSHAHADHVAGLAGLLQSGARPTVFVLPSFPRSLKSQVESLTDLVEVTPGQAVAAGMWTTGEMSGPVREQALMIRTAEGLIVVTGCAHPGIVRIVERAKELADDPVRLVVGGFHLLDKNRAQVEAIVDGFRRLGVQQVSPTHCTGEEAIALFAETYGDDYVEAGAGRTMVVEVASSTETPSSAAEIAVSLQGLTLDEFFEASYAHLLLRSPETLTELGTAASYGLRNDQLDNLSDTYVRETQAIEAAILDLLRTYDRGALPPEQQVSYDVYEWWLDNRVRGHAFMYYDYPVHHFLGGYHDELTRLLTEIHPLANAQDAEDYVARLAQVNEQVDQLLEGLRLREAAGVIPPQFIIEMAKEAISQYLGTRSRDPSSIPVKGLTVYTTFRDKLDEIDDLSADETQALLDATAAEIESSFIPAYLKLLGYLDELETISTDDAGVWKFPSGDAYYAFILRDQTSTDLAPQEIHELGLAEVARIKAEMRQVFSELGYSENESFGRLLRRATDDAGYYAITSQAGKHQLIEAYENIIAEADASLDEAFDLRPEADVVVLGGPTGGYYVPGSNDGTRPGAFHVGTSGSWAPKYFMKSLAFHEAIPGHHFQIAIAQELDLPTFRTDVFFNGYVEGWALYAERLAWELGLYENDPYGNVGRLDFELLRAVRLVVDTGIHALGWTREQANNYMAEAFGAPPGTTYYEVDRYIVRPAQATGYKIGMLKILELRQRAMDALGDHFDLKAFHRVVVGNGSLPLEILEQVVDDYVEQEQQN